MGSMSSKSTGANDGLADVEGDTLAEGETLSLAE